MNGWGIRKHIMVMRLEMTSENTFPGKETKGRGFKEEGKVNIKAQGCKTAWPVRRTGIRVQSECLAKEKLTLRKKPEARTGEAPRRPEASCSDQPVLGRRARATLAWRPLLPGLPLRAAHHLGAARAVRAALRPEAISAQSGFFHL